MNTKLPCFYYPTMTTIIDDDQVFLENLPENLSEQIIYQRFDNPHEALQFLQNQQSKTPTSHDFLQPLDELASDADQHGKHAVSINLSTIHNKLYNPERFSMPSVVVVDHDMPGMNGIEFCQALGDHPIKKIMLTGVTDHKIAIKAFNDGIIHRFIMKDDPNVFEFIDKAIIEMRNDYFSTLSETIIRNITASTFSYLKDKKFITFLLDFFNKHSIIEFYLIDLIGSFLLLNTKGELSWLIVKSEQNIQNDCQIAIDQNASDDVIDNLTKRQKLLFLFSEEDHKQSVEKWPSFLYTANEVDDIQGCYYSFIQGENAYHISGVQKDNIFSFSNFVNSQPAETEIK